MSDTATVLYMLARKMLEAIEEAPAPDPAPRLLTFEQAGEMLAVGRTTVQELVDAGTLPVVPVTGRAVRVDVRDIEALIKARRMRRGLTGY